MLRKDFDPSKGDCPFRAPKPTTPSATLRGLRYWSRPLQDSPLSLIPPSERRKTASDFANFAVLSSEAWGSNGLLTPSQANYVRTYSQSFVRDQEGFLYPVQEFLADPETPPAAGLHNHVSASDSVTNPPFSSPHFEIDVDYIRSITKFTTSPITPWNPLPQRIEWQERFLADTHKLVIVEGSRQMGKSHTISNSLMECSHIPGFRQLVCAFQSSTTNVIRDYVLKLTENFPQDTFEYFAREGYVINKATSSRIYFRTLSDDAKNILGMTMDRVVVDEAQLVSRDVIENVLAPTLTTTDGQMVLIGTPGIERKCYMYEELTAYKRDPSAHPHTSVYTVDWTKNPFVSPTVRDRILANPDDPSIRRQYCCDWNSEGQKLFNAPVTSSLPFDPFDPPANVHTVLALDPARVHDRSAYTILSCSQELALASHSSFVPDEFKAEWKTQASFYLSLISRFSPSARSTLRVAMDVTGVGDGVVALFRDNGIRVTDTVRYVGGSSESVRSNAGDFSSFKGSARDWRVGKSSLISNLVDLCQDKLTAVFKHGCVPLLEELDLIVPNALPGGREGMRSDFFDDCANSYMIACYVAVKQRLLSPRTRTSQLNSAREEFLADPILSRRRAPSALRKSSNW